VDRRWRPCGLESASLAAAWLPLGRPSPFALRSQGDLCSRASRISSRVVRAGLGARHGCGAGQNHPWIIAPLMDRAPYKLGSPSRREISGWVGREHTLLPAQASLSGLRDPSWFRSLLRSVIGAGGVVTLPDARVRPSASRRDEQLMLRARDAFFFTGDSRGGRPSCSFSEEVHSRWLSHPAFRLAPCGVLPCMWSENLRSATTC